MCEALVPIFVQQHADDFEAAVRQTDVPWSVIQGAARYLADMMTPAWEPVDPPVVAEMINQDGCIIITFKSRGMTILAIRNFGEVEWGLMTTSFGCRMILQVSRDENNQWNWKKKVSTI